MTGESSEDGDRFREGDLDPGKGEAWAGPRFGLKLPDGPKYSPSALAWMTSHPYAWQFGLRKNGLPVFPLSDPPPAPPRVSTTAEPAAVHSWNLAAPFPSALGPRPMTNLGVARVPQRLRPIDHEADEPSDRGGRHSSASALRPLDLEAVSRFPPFPPSQVMTAHHMHGLPSRDGSRSATGSRLSLSDLRKPRASRLVRMYETSPAPRETGS